MHKKVRPKHLDLTKIRIPVPGQVSFFHRVSGVLMFILLPFALYLLKLSLSSPTVFASAHTFFTHPLIKLMSLALMWAFLHHACAGIRFLLLDVHKGIDLKTARASAYAVFGVSIVLTLILGSLVLL